MNRRSRFLSLVVFFAMVGTVQVIEGLIRWYIHRDDLTQMVELREELIDLGAEMIEWQLAADHLREQLESTSRSHSVTNGLPRTDDVPSAVSHLDRATREAGSRQARTLARNRQLNELNEMVARRNSATVRYHVLVDSIRTIAARAREPFFTIPLPAEAAIRRGVTSTATPWADTRPRSTGTAMQWTRIESASR